MNVAKQLLRDLNLPDGDRYDLPDWPPLSGWRPLPHGDSQRRGTGSHGRRAEAAKCYGVTIHRVSQGSGMMLLTDAELHELARLGAQHRVEVSLFVGPRAPWEGTGQPLTPDGKLMGWRHTGMDQLAYAFEDIVRGWKLASAASWWPTRGCCGWWTRRASGACCRPTWW